MNGDEGYPAQSLDLEDWTEPPDRLHDGYTGYIGPNNVTITDLRDEGSTHLTIDADHAIMDATEWC